MLISMIVVIFKVFPLFIQKGVLTTQHPISGQNIQCVCLIFFIPNVAKIFLLMKLGSPVNAQLGCTAKLFAILFFILILALFGKIVCKSRSYLEY